MFAGRDEFVGASERMNSSRVKALLDEPTTQSAPRTRAPNAVRRSPARMVAFNIRSVGAIALPRTAALAATTGASNFCDGSYSKTFPDAHGGGVKRGRKQSNPKRGGKPKHEKLWLATGSHVGMRGDDASIREDEIAVEEVAVKEEVEEESFVEKIKRAPSSSRFPGVSWSKGSNRWQACKCVMDADRGLRHVYLGSYVSQQDAVKAVADFIERGIIPARFCGASSKFRGVSWCKRTKRWAVQIADKGKQSRLGHFSSEQEAALVYNEAVRRLGRPTSWLNVISDDERECKSSSRSLAHPEAEAHIPGSTTVVMDTRLTPRDDDTPESLSRRSSRNLACVDVSTVASDSQSDVDFAAKNAAHALLILAAVCAHG